MDLAEGEIAGFEAFDVAEHFVFGVVGVEGGVGEEICGAVLNASYPAFLLK